MIGIAGVIDGLLNREIAIDCGPNVGEDDISWISAIIDDELKGEVDIRNAQKDIKKYIMDHRCTWPYLVLGSNIGAKRFAMCNKYYLAQNNISLISISDISGYATEQTDYIYSFESVFAEG